MRHFGWLAFSLMLLHGTGHGAEAPVELIMLESGKVVEERGDGTAELRLVEHGEPTGETRAVPRPPRGARSHLHEIRGENR